MALTVTVLVDQFRTLGMSQAVVQADSLTERQVSGLFWVNAAVGLLLAGVVALSAPLVAGFYSEPELRAIVLALSGSYLVAGLAVQPSAILLRTMEFRALAIRNLIARLLAGVTAVGAALAGAGYWSLVVLHISLVVYSAVLVWVAVDWRPSAPRALRGTAPLVRFGANITVADLANAVSRNVDNILIGRFVGADALGLYTRAYSLFMLPLRQLKTPLGAAIIPMMAAVKDEPERYRRLYTSTIGALSYVGVPLLATLVVVAEPLIGAVLGEQWLGAVPIFQLLAVAGIVQLGTSTFMWLLITIGRAKEYAGIALLGSGLSVVFIVAGLPWGAVGVAGAIAVGSVITFLPKALFCTNRNPAVSLRDILTALGKPLIVGVVVAATASVARWLTLDWTQVGIIVFVAAVAAITWLGIVWAWPTARGDLQALLRLRRRGASTAASSA